MHCFSHQKGLPIFGDFFSFDVCPLPKTIQQGQKFMDNMNLPTLQYQKTHIITYNNEDYYLHHLSLINCIKNILSIPNLFPNFKLNFKKIEVIILINYHIN